MNNLRPIGLGQGMGKGEFGMGNGECGMRKLEKAKKIGF